MKNEKNSTWEGKLSNNCYKEMTLRLLYDYKHYYNYNHNCYKVTVTKAITRKI